MTNLAATGGVPGPGRIGRVAIGDLLKRAAARFPGSHRADRRRAPRDLYRARARRQPLRQLSGEARAEAGREDIDHLQQLRRVRQSAVRHSPRRPGLGADQHHARPGRHGLHPRSRRGALCADRRQSACAGRPPRRAGKARHADDRDRSCRQDRRDGTGEFQRSHQGPVRDRAGDRDRRPRSRDDHLHVGHDVAAEGRDALSSRRGHGGDEQRHRNEARPGRRHHRAVSAVPLRRPCAAAELSVGRRPDGADARLRSGGLHGSHRARQAHRVRRPVADVPGDPRSPAPQGVRSLRPADLHLHHGADGPSAAGARHGRHVPEFRAELRPDRNVSGDHDVAAGPCSSSASAITGASR